LRRRGKEKEGRGGVNNREGEQRRGG